MSQGGKHAMDDSENHYQPRQATPVTTTGVASSHPANDTTQLPTVEPVAARLSQGGCVGSGDFIVRVTDFDLAVCLISVGVSLRTDPPYTHSKLKNGQHRWVWNFNTMTSDGKAKTVDLIKQYNQGLRYINDAGKGDTALAGAIAALQNRTLLVSHMRKSKPWIGFRHPGGSAVMLVIEGSKKAANARQRGMVRCDPFEDQKHNLTK